MRKLMGKVVASVLILALAFGVPIASRTVRTEVKADNYELVWSDEFNGSSLDRSNWTTETGTGDWGWGNNEQQFYRDSTDNIEVSNGTLKIHALKQSYGGKQYTSARMKTQGKHSFKYGKIEARIRLPRFEGAWPAFWMLGDNINSVGWPKCGEMDIMEAINNNNNIYSNLHWSYNNQQADTQGKAYNVGDRTEWHTYGMIWTEKEAKFYVDGNVFQTNAITTDAQMEEFRAKQFIILNLAIGGQWPGYVIDDSAFPDRSTMEVDYVRVYQITDEPTTKYDGPTIVVEQDSVTEKVDGWNSFFGGTGWIKTEGDFNPSSNNSEGYSIDITNAGYIGNDSMWSIQGNLEFIPFYKGATYTYTCTLTSSKDKRVYVKVADGNEGEMSGDVVDLRANTPVYYHIDVDIPEDFDSTVSLKFGWGKMQGDSIADHDSLHVEVRDVSFKTTTWIPDPDYTTTPAPTTTRPVVTTKPSETTTSKTEPITAETTTKSAVTTKKVSPTKKKITVVKVGKTKIKKVKKKKKSLKFKLKKIKGASGYQIRYSDAKNFDGYWEKNVKKAKVKLKKLDRKTKYYIKARAYKKKGNIYFFGKFSKVKKVKTK